MMIDKEKTTSMMIVKISSGQSSLMLLSLAKKINEKGTKLKSKLLCAQSVESVVHGSGRSLTRRLVA
jgi:hypothetical protein